MGRIIAIANQKGGVGKTTTAINLSAALVEKGKKVLLIDLDPQGNSTSGLGIDKNEQNTIYHLLVEDLDIVTCIRKSVWKALDLIPSTVNLAGAEIEMLDIPRHEFILKTKIHDIENDYDYVIIDCPPSLNLLTVNALTTANSVLVPIQCEFYAMEGLTQLMYTIQLVQKKLNPSLRMEGVVFTMYDVRTNLSQQVVDSVKQYLKDKVYETIIPRNVRLAEAPSHGMPILEYDSRSTGAYAYRRLAEEVIQYD
ncbi:MAG: ParA family protein [Firmicutes bacterium]|nr:ParA family protein [Bacillota bacterium]MBR6405764.1 ParA family protein [Lachnospiraceae bacterium]